MTTFIELLLGGLSIGSVYALIALGFVVIFKATEVVNFAHASLLLAGGYVTAVLHDDIGFWPTLGVGIAGAAVVGSAVEFFVMRRYRGSDQSVLAIVTIGVDILLTTELTRRMGTDVMSLGDPWGDDVVTVGGVTLAETRIAAFLVAGLLITVFLLAFRFTSWGVSMRAAAENPRTAALMGIRLGRVSSPPGRSPEHSPRSPRSSSPCSRHPAWNGPPHSPRSRRSPPRSSAASTRRRGHSSGGSSSESPSHSPRATRAISPSSDAASVISRRIW